MNTYQLNYTRRAHHWWDQLTLSQKAWYGQLYPEYANKTNLIYKTYDEYIKNRSHLHVVK